MAYHAHGDLGSMACEKSALCYLLLLGFYEIHLKGEQNSAERKALENRIGTRCGRICSPQNKCLFPVEKLFYTIAHFSNLEKYQSAPKFINLRIDSRARL